MKAICIIRTSTDRQHIEEQRAEVLQMARADGYADEDIEIIGKCGASAIKLDDAYMENLTQLYERIESGDVAVVYAWAIDRIGRDEVVLMQLKNTLASKKIQLKIKNPSLSLLNFDGSVNAGVELAFSLFATMAKQEMQQKKARFHRGKKQAAESGKHNGGTVAFGYSVDENRFLIINESEAETVRLTFELMASGKYTKAGVTNELRARGVMAYDRLITYQFVVSILNNTAYIGYRNKYAFNKKYPRIISDELFNMAHDVMRSNNSTKAKATKHYNFAALLIKCPDCGRHYIAHGEKYVCSGWNAPTIRTAMGQDRCNNNIIIRQKHLDGMLWSIATRQHYNYIKGLDEQQKKDILHQIEILKQKQTESNKRIDETVERYERVDDVYMSGRMTKEKYQKQIQLISDDEKTLRNEIAQYDEEIARLNAMLSDSGKDEFSAWFDNNYMLNDVISTDDEKTMYDIVHKYIIGVELERAEIPECSVIGEIIVNGKAVKPSFKLTGRKALKVSVRCYNDETVTVYYIPNLRGTDKKIVSITDGLAEPFEYEPILRYDNGNVTTVIATLAKALNNAIIEHLSNDATADDFITLIESVKKYDCAYIGNFDEAGELAPVAKAFNALHKQRNFIATVRTLSAAAKKYNVNSDDMTTHILSTLKV